MTLSSAFAEQRHANRPTSAAGNASGPEPVKTTRAARAYRTHLPLNPASIPVNFFAHRPIEPSHPVSFNTLLPLQRKLAIGATSDPLEAEADRVADQVMGMAAPSPQLNVSGAGPAVRRKCACEGSGAECPECQKKKEEKLQRKAQSPAPVEAPPIVHNVLRSPGQALDSETRAFMEPRLNHDLSRVRIHTGPSAEASARAVNALAYTVGQDAVFAAGQYNPRTHEGRRLLAHELSHTIQQSSGHDAAAGSSTNGGAHGVLQRQHNSGDPQGTPGQLPPVQVPGAGITVIPGPPDLTSLAGLTVPLPSSLRLTNALSAGSGPTFVADVAPRRLVLTLLDGIDLSTSTRSGTPPNSAPSAENQARIRLIRPVLIFNTASQTFHGHATLQIQSDYSPALHGPTELDVIIDSTELGEFTGRVGIGPLHANFSLRLHYQTERLEQVLSPAFRPQGGLAGFSARFQQILRDTIPGIRLENFRGALDSLVRSFQAGHIQGGEFAERTVALLASSLPPSISAENVRTAVNQFVHEISYPSLNVSGTAGIGGLPFTFFGAEAPTTAPIAHPLPGAPTNFPINAYAAGVVAAPAGAITQTPVPAVGVTATSFNERRGMSVTGAVLPTISPTAISAGQGFVSEFPTYAYAEVSYVRRISRDLDMGVRLTVDINTAQVWGPRATPPADPAARLSQSIQNYQTAAGQAPGTDTPPTPNLGISVFGRFSGL